MDQLKKFYQSKINQGSLPVWAGPLLLFLTCFFSFGVLLARLGFFQDDWHHVYYALQEGPGSLMRFLLQDGRPLAFVVYVPFFKLLGVAPANWHWSLMILRFLSVLAFWNAARCIWPNRPGMVTWLALLFAIYPAYPLQALSVAYTLHWFLYAVFLLSIVFMLQAARRQDAYVKFTIPALVLQIFQLLMIEYYAGLEFIRPVLLWLIFRELPARERWKKVLKHWLPYLGVLGLYVIYRLSFHAIYGYERFTLDLLVALAKSPLDGARIFLQAVLQDFIYVLVSPWYAAIDPAIIDLSRASTLGIFLGIGGFAVLGYFVTSRIEKPESEASGEAGRKLFLAGGLSILLGLLPAWLAGLYLFSKNPLWSGRLALPAMLGASMILTGLVYWLVERPAHRHLVLSIVLGLGVGFQIQTARDFQTSWDKQLQFYWQMHWRAPGLIPNTLIVSDAEILPYMGYYPTAFALNVLYDQPASQTKTTAASQDNAEYWFDSGSEHIDWNTFGQGLPATFSHSITTFTATNKEVVSISFEPQLQRCLWILRPSYEEARFLSDEAYHLMDKSNLDRILPQSDSIPPAIFGTEPKHTWCYYYEKADLASQQADWPGIVRLWQQANDGGFSPAASIELMPFIEAFGKTGDWETARRLTMQANAFPPRAPSMLCTLWKTLEKDTLPGGQREQAMTQTKDKLQCQE